MKEREGVFFIFSIVIHIFFPKIQIFFVVYSDFVLDQSGRSACRAMLSLTIQSKQVPEQWFLVIIF